MGTPGIVLPLLTGVKHLRLAKRSGLQGGSSWCIEKTNEADMSVGLIIWLISYVSLGRGGGRYCNVERRDRDQVRIHRT